MILLILLSVPAFANPCKQVVSACEKAGFTQRGAKNGKDLFVDCVNLIMQGETQPAKATLVLPILESSVVADCKKQHPKFGEAFKKK